MKAKQHSIVSLVCHVHPAIDKISALRPAAASSRSCQTMNFTELDYFELRILTARDKMQNTPWQLLLISSQQR